jgi:hypothetical protein
MPPQPPAQTWVAVTGLAGSEAPEDLVLEIGDTQPELALAMVGDLERTHHGPFFSLIPVFSLFGVVLAATLGAALRPGAGTLASVCVVTSAHP